MFENQIEQPHLAHYHEQYRQTLPRSIISNAYVHISFSYSSTSKLVRSLLIDNEPTRFVVSSHVHSKISHFSHSQYEPTHFVVVLIFTLTAAITIPPTSSAWKTNKTIAFLRERIYELHFIQDSALFVDCLTLAITRHHVHQYHLQYHSSENSTRACQIPLSIRKVTHSCPFLLRTSNSTALNQPCMLHAIQSSTTHAY